MFKRSFGIAMAFIGVLAGASFASGREALQYFVAFGNWGIVGLYRDCHDGLWHHHLADGVLSPR